MICQQTTVYNVLIYNTMILHCNLCVQSKWRENYFAENDRNKFATINFSRSVLHSRLWEIISEENTD